jgi:hypothetical protein
MLRRVLKLRIIFPIILILLVSPVLAQEFTYKDYAKGSEPWRRGFVFGISQYMSAVAQPDEEPPYPVRTSLRRCLGASTDTILLRRVEAYVAANPGLSNAPMSTVVLRALFDLCRADVSKAKPSTPAPGHR